MNAIQIPAPAAKKYLVMAVKPGIIHRHECCSTRAAATATRFYRKAGWAVTVLPEFP